VAPAAQDADRARRRFTAGAAGKYRTRKMPFGGQTACRAGVTKDIQDRHRRRARCVSARLLSVPA